MATKNNRRVIMTQRILKETLVELMKEKEISQISIRELCEKADLNRSTFYLHYLDQFDLLNQIEEEVIQNTLTQFQNTESSVISPKVIEVFLSYIKDNGDLFQVLLCKNESSAFKKKLIGETVSQLSQSLKFRIEENLLPYVYTFLMDGCSGILIQWIKNDYAQPAKDIANLIYGLCQSARTAKMPSVD